MKRLTTFLLIGSVFGLANIATADGLNDRLKNIFGNATVEVSDYNESLKMVVVDSKQFMFASLDGRYLYAGPVLDTLRNVNIVAEQDSQRRLSVLDAQPEDVFIQYPSVGASKHQLTVFTDVDCGYCRKLHNTMSQLNQYGLSVNYVMLPRAGVNSTSYTKTMSALCSKDPAKSITLAMQNKSLNEAQCDSTQLSQHMALARELGITATPTIVLPNGDIQPGFKSADALIKILNKES